MSGSLLETSLLNKMRTSWKSGLSFSPIRKALGAKTALLESGRVSHEHRLLLWRH